MKLSTRARYALRMMLEVHKHSRSGEPVHLGDVAKRTQLSRGYLEQMVVSLKTASLLRGISGRGGGYLLARSAEQIKIVEIIEAVIGPIGIVNCVHSPESCLQSDVCDCHLLWSLVSMHIREDLSAFSLADMAARSWRGKIQERIATLQDQCFDHGAGGDEVVHSQGSENDTPGSSG